MVRKKALPHAIDTENLLPSQFSQHPSQEPFSFRSQLPASQATSTPINCGIRQPLSFGNEGPLSPIDFDYDDCHPFENSDDEIESPRRSVLHSPLAALPVVHDEESGNLRDQIYRRSNASFSLSGSRAVISGGVDRFNSLRKTRTGGIKKKAKAKTGTVALREIKMLQKTTNPLLKNTPFLRIVKEVIENVSRGGFRIQTCAVHALRDAAEAFLVQLYEAAYLCANHARRITLMPQDIQLVRRILAMFGNQTF